MIHIIQQLEHDINSEVATKKLSGLVLGIVRDGRVTYAKAFGVQNVDTGEPVTVRSIFHTASVAKTVVGTAMMQLVEVGKVRLDDSVTCHLPYLKTEDSRYERITLRHLLTHTSGLVSEPDDPDFWWAKPEYDDGALERFVRSLTSWTLAAEPGQQFAYSNNGFSILGDVISKVSGLTFEAYVKQHILMPAGMVDSTFMFTDLKTEQMAWPHMGNDAAEVSQMFPFTRQHTPSSSFLSNIDEMGRWALIHLNHGELDGKRILQAASYDQMWGQYVQSSETEWRGLGWVHFAHREHAAVGHDGWDTGYGATFWLFPNDNVAAIVLCNKDLGLYDIYPIAERLSDVALDTA